MVSLSWLSRDCIWLLVLLYACSVTHSSALVEATADVFKPDRLAKFRSGIVYQQVNRDHHVLSLLEVDGESLNSRMEGEWSEGEDPEVDEDRFQSDEKLKEEAPSQGVEDADFLESLGMEEQLSTESPKPDNIPEQKEEQLSTESPEIDTIPEQKEEQSSTESPEPDTIPEQNEELSSTERSEPDTVPEQKEAQSSTKSPERETIPEQKREQSSPESSQPEAMSEQKDDVDARIARARQKTEPFVVSNPRLLGPPIKDWDKQRATWLEENPQFQTTPSGKPRVLIITGSPPYPAVIRKLMLTHPEIEWVFWVDADAVFTDMLFEPPFHTYEDHNLVLWGWLAGLFKKRSWVSINDGVFLLRNCQWSLDFIDKWSAMGHEETRHTYGKMINAYFSDRKDQENAGDQPPLAYLILTDEAVRSKVKIVEGSSYLMSSWWVVTVGRYETLMENYHPGLGDYRWPWITHFTGCSPCEGGSNQKSGTYNDCIGNITRAYNFAHNQVLAYMGFQHTSLSSTWSVIRIKNETDRPLVDFVGVNPWEARMAQVDAAREGSPRRN